MTEPLSSKSILIVDDDPDIREVIKDCLDSLGCELILAESAESAWKLIPSTPVHAILCDMSMPGMNGIELLRHVRDSGSDVPFFLLTGFVDTKQQQEAADLGVTGLLEKPFSDAFVRDLIRKTLELKTSAS